MIPETRKLTRIGTLEMLPRKVDQLGGTECSVVDTGLVVCCVLVEVGLVSRRGCSRRSVLGFSRCDVLLSRSFGWFTPIVDHFLFAI